MNYEHQLDLQLALANRLRDQLERIEKLRHSVLNLDSKTIAEIKTYSNPPDGVHQSMMATFILLGNTPKEVRVRHNFYSLTPIHVYISFAKVLQEIFNQK